MMSTSLHDAALLDQARLDELARMRLLDTPPEEPFDRLTRLAARVLGAPVALVSLVDDHRQFFKSTYGLPEPWASQRQTDLSHSFCQHVVASSAPLRIVDAREHPLVRDNLAVTELNVIAYLGVPLTTSAGKTLGSFCVLASQPTNWTMKDQTTLSELGASVMSEIALRSAHHDLLAANERLQRDAVVRETVVRELRYSEDRLRAAQRLAHVGSFELHTEPTPDCHWSPEARRIIGLGARKPATTIDAFVASFVDPNDRARVAQTLRRAASQQTCTEIEYRTLPEEGEARTLLTRFETEMKTNGSAVIVCTAVDVTERHRAEASLAEYRSQLWHVARVATAGEMVTVIAHELNQPLAAIAHTANACGRLDANGSLSGGDLKAHLNTIGTQAKRASEIIRRMRGYVRKQPPEQKPLDLDRLVDDTLALLAPLTRSLGIEVVRRGSGTLPQVLGDEVQLGQLILNLIRNAFDAVKQNPPRDRLVAVATSNTDKDGVVLEVADNGPGISPDVQDKIFEPFFTTRRNGLGMGLSIASTIAKSHGATLSVETRAPGEKGAVARVCLMPMRR